MKFSAFILANLDTIVQEWGTFARVQLPTSHPLSELALRDHVRDILMIIAKNIESGQANVRDVKSRYLDREAANAVSPASSHGALRQLEGLDVAQLFGEFRTLRATVLRMWQSVETAKDFATANEIAQFDEGIDKAVAESIERYAKNVATFMAVIGHDLRSPLWAIKGSSEMLSTGAVSEEVRGDVLARITRSCEAMGHVIDDLAEFTETYLGRSEAVQLSTCDLTTICEASLEAVRTRHPRQEFVMTASGDLVVRADPRRMQQVMINLLNGAAFRNAKRSPVRIDLQGKSSSVAIQVTCNGRSGAAGALQSILDPDLDKPVSRATPHQGPYTNLGIGLLIVREILSRHGGHITLQSDDEIERTTVEVPR